MMHSKNGTTLHNATPTWRVVYICSSARCGSTFTDMFLGGHSRAASLGEVNLLGKAIVMQQSCACGVSVRDCGHWSRVYDDLAARSDVDLRRQPYGYRLWDALAWNTVDRNRQTVLFRLAVNLRKAWLDLRHRIGNRLPLLPSQTVALQNKNILYESVAKQWDKSVIIDSSKNAREAVELNRLMPGRVKVVLVTRDGRGVFLSRRSSQRGQAESLAGWMNYYRRALPLLQSQIATDDLLILRYEDLAAEPEHTGRRLCQFVGLDFESSMLDLAITTRHLVNGNDTRLAADKGIRLDERWRSALVGEDLQYFEKYGTGMNKRLGYS